MEMILLCHSFEAVKPFEVLEADDLFNGTDIVRFQVQLLQVAQTKD